MRRVTGLLLGLFAASLLTGCFATKIVSVPMRVVGALASVTPAVGNTVHDVIDEGADLVDQLPY